MANERVAHANGIGLVCFDLGGVLVRVADGWQTASAAAGVSLRPDWADGARVLRLRELYLATEVGRTDTRTFAGQAAAELGLTREQVMRIATAWLFGAYPGAVDLLRGLAAHGVRTACLSNTNDHHWEMLNRPGGFDGLDLSLLDHRFASHELGRAKPDPAIYRDVERATGVAAERILFFDDLAENCRAAAACGWRVRPVQSGGDPVGQMVAGLREHGLGM